MRCKPKVSNPVRLCATMCVSALALLLLPVRPAAAAGGPYVLGIVPAAAPVATHASWTPLVERLAKETGMDLKLKVYEEMLDFEADLTRGGPDFAFSNPLQAVGANAAQGYVPLVRSSRSLAGLLVVGKDSPITSVEQLAGLQIAFVGARSV